MAAFNEADIFDDDGGLGEELAFMTADDIVRRSRLLDNEIRVLKVRSLHLGCLEALERLPNPAPLTEFRPLRANCLSTLIWEFAHVDAVIVENGCLCHPPAFTSQSPLNRCMHLT